MKSAKSPRFSPESTSLFQMAARMEIPVAPPAAHPVPAIDGKLFAELRLEAEAENNPRARAGISSRGGAARLPVSFETVRHIVFVHNFNAHSLSASSNHF